MLVHSAAPSWATQFRSANGHPPTYVQRLWTRRGVVTTALETMGVVLASTFCVPLALADDNKRRIFTNIDDAREAGERLRDEKESARGPIVTLPSGVRYRELAPGEGRPIGIGDLVSIHYVIYRSNGFYVDSLGYGFEGKDDIDDTLTFEYGKGLVPKAIELGMGGMKAREKRRILVQPEFGWVGRELLPKPTSFAAERRLSNRSREPLIFEVEIDKIKPDK